MNNLLVWCSGASKEALVFCDEKEQMKYTNLGMINLIVAFLSSLSFTYALTYAFGTDGSSFNPYFYPLGLIWGFNVLALDRAIISSINKKDSVDAQFFKAIPRISLAIIIGIVLSTPLELKIFEKEINKTIQAETLEIIKKEKSDKFKNEYELFDTKVKEAEALYLSDKAMYEDEVKGKKSGIPGKGARANEYMKNELASLSAYTTIKDNFNVFKQEMVDFEKQVDFDKEVALYINENVGLIKRTQVLHGLGKMSIAITILLVLIELLPTIVKLLSPSGSYEEIHEMLQQDSILTTESVIREKFRNDKIERKEKRKVIDLKDFKTQIEKDKLSKQLEYDLELIRYQHIDRVEKQNAKHRQSMKSESLT